MTKYISYFKVSLNKYRFFSAAIIIVLVTLIGCNIGDSDEGPDLDDFDSGPVILSIIPEMGPPKSIVLIRGTDFDSAVTGNMVFFNNSEAVINSASDTLLQVMVPDSATTGPVKVVTREQEAVGPVFTVEEEMPVITSVTPDSGVAGTLVTIRGMNFGENIADVIVRFNGTDAQVNSASDTLLVAEVPDDATTGPVEVVVDEVSIFGPVFTVLGEGTIEVLVFTSGDALDDDGYELLLDNGVESRLVAVNDTIFFNNVTPGARELELTGVASNCMVSGSNPRMVDVTAGSTASTTFNVECTQTTGALEAIVSTTGVDLDPDGYTLVLDGGASSQPVGINGMVTFDDLAPGMRQVELTGVAANCTVSGSNPRMVDVTAGSTASTTFNVECTDVIRDQIVFSSSRDGNLEIYVMNPDGSSQTRLTNNSSTEADPAVSPDGSKIAFISDTDGNLEIFIMDADGTNIQQITFTADASNVGPKWSPDGTKLVFSRVTTSQPSGQVTQIIDIFTINVDGSGENNLTMDQSNDIDPDWSPDGNRIAFSSDRDGDFEIYTMNTNGTGILQLTTNSFAEDRAPDWSPDGSQIAFQSNQLQSDDIFIMNSDGSGQSAVTVSFASDTDPSWSPDGLQIAFMSDRDGNTEIYKINSDGSGVINLTNNQADDITPGWSSFD